MATRGAPHEHSQSASSVFASDPSEGRDSRALWVPESASAADFSYAATLSAPRSTEEAEPADAEAVIDRQ